MIGMVPYKKSGFWAVNRLVVRASCNIFLPCPIPLSDWVADKESSHFAFEGMCWAKSFIPKLIWQAGERTSNLIESVHADVNREGIHCTLLGGVLKGEFYDALQMKTLKVSYSSVSNPNSLCGIRHLREQVFVRHIQRGIPPKTLSRA
jgi:hypothetical protein